MPVADLSASIPARFARAIAKSRLSQEQKIGVAVSGGGDSIALMHLAVRLCGPDRLRVLTVDHGLRPEAKDEIALVAAQAAALGVDHTVVHWAWDGRGNLQAAARDGRWAAIRDWARMHDLQEVLLGHTADDQVETVLMRLARGSGVDGLAAMFASTQRDGLCLLRPLLAIARADLRAWLAAERIAWCDDPSNKDPRFDRVRARQLSEQLSALGLTRKRVLQTVDHMQAARVSLQAAAQAFALTHVRQDAGDLLFAPDVLDLEVADTPRRVMSAALGWVASRGYRPRFEQLLETAAQAREGATVTLGGCILAPEGDGTVRLMREAAATGAIIHQPRGSSHDTGLLWDRRWFLEGPLADGLSIKALGDAVRHCPNWRETGLPRASLLASPAVWNGDTLVAAPLAGLRNGWSARIVADFHTSAFAIED